MNATSQSAWFAVYTKPREEYRARDNLQRQGYQVFLPLLRRERLRAGRRILQPEPLFSRYLFVSLSAIDDNWYSLRSTRGVHRIVEFGQGPEPVPDALIDGLQSTESPVQNCFRPGDRVRITEGAFRDIEAIYAAPDGEQRVFLLLNILGRNRKLSLPLKFLQ